MINAGGSCSLFGVVWLLGEGAASSGIVIVTSPRIQITRSVSKSPQVALEQCFSNSHHGEEITSERKREWGTPNDLRHIRERVGRFPQGNYIKGVEWGLLLLRMKSAKSKVYISAGSPVAAAITFILNGIVLYIPEAAAIIGSDND
ncbi:hypothetical protein TNCV_2845511 [Trichonephila clavipes]|nr:hypothetical protein TNCV_2845511 [Trichonephila clavipes]